MASVFFAERDCCMRHIISDGGSFFLYRGILSKGQKIPLFIL